MAEDSDVAKHRAATKKLYSSTRGKHHVGILIIKTVFHEIHTHTLCEEVSFKTREDLWN